MKRATLTLALVAWSSSVAAEPPCLPRNAEPWFGARGVIVMCDFMSATVTCHEVKPDGAVKPVPTPPKPLRAEVSGSLVEICPGDGGECDNFNPMKTTDLAPWMADVDLRGQRATVILQARGASSAVAEVWDVAKSRRLARTTLTGSGTDDNTFYAWLLGRTILIGVESDDVSAYSLWKLRGSKLTRFKTLDRQPKLWVVLDDRTAVMRWDDGAVDILDTARGTVVHVVKWNVLLPRPTPTKGVFLAKMGDRKYAIAPYDADRKTLGLGVGDAKGKVTPYPVTFCP